MEYKKAREIAVRYWEKFRPLCDRVKVAGSVRREKAECGDIELVCIPLDAEFQDGLFDKKIVRDPEFVKYVNSFPRVKGNGEGKYTQLLLPEGIKLDLFMCNEDNFGLMWMIRTGSEYFSKRMVTEIKTRGFYCYDGYLWNDNHEKISVKEEMDFFTITRTKFIKPTMRQF